MSDESISSRSSNKNNNGWNNPQVVIALITGLVTVAAALIGILPDLLQADAATPTPTYTPTFTATVAATVAVTVVVTEITPSTIAPTDAPLMLTDTPEAQGIATDFPTVAPTIEPVVAIEAPQPNALLIYDNVSFSLVNTSGRRLSLANVTFESGSRIWEALAWANYRRIPNGNCLRIRDASAGNRNPPGECSELLSLLLIGKSVMFWTEADTFDVLQGSAVIATCTTDTDRCAIYIPQN